MAAWFCFFLVLSFFFFSLFLFFFFFVLFFFFFLFLGVFLFFLLGRGVWRGGAGGGGGGGGGGGRAGGCISGAQGHGWMIDVVYPSSLTPTRPSRRSRPRSIGAPGSRIGQRRCSRTHEKRTGARHTSPANSMAAIAMLDSSRHVHIQTWRTDWFFGGF